MWNFKDAPTPGPVEPRVKPAADTSAGRRTGVECAIAAGYTAVYLCVVMIAAWRQPFPNNYDELAHLSYVVHAARYGLPHIDFGSMVLLRPDLAPGFTSAHNYLNHPPTYYLALSLFMPNEGWPVPGTVLVLRCLNAGLSTLAVGCALAVVALRRVEPRMLLLAGAMIVCVPTLRHIGGAINNDNLALAGGCACVLGAQLLRLSDASRAGRILLVAGLVTATSAKLTAALLTGVFVLVFLLILWRSNGHRPDKRFVTVLIAAVLIAGLPYIWYFVVYGSPAPSPPAFYEVYRQAAQAGDGVRGWVAGQLLSPLEYAGHFLLWLFANWNPATTMSGWPNFAVLFAPALVLLLAVPAFLANAPHRRGADAVLAAGGTALAVMLPLHLLFSYQLHAATLSPPMDAVPRYYFPIALALIPASVGWTLARIPPMWRVVLIWVVLLGLFAALPILSLCPDHACP
jgi:hypothetical protein